MNIRQLTYYCSAARAGSFSAAAAEADVSVQAVSKSLSELESEVGAVLFTRDSAGSRLTTYGRAFLPYAERAVEAFSGVEHAAKKLGGDTVQRKGADLVLVIGAPLFLNHKRFCLALEKFLSFHLRCKVAVSMYYEDEALLALEEGHCDAVIAVGNVSEDLYDARTIGKVSTAAFFAKGHPLSSKRVVTISELSQYPVVNSTAINRFSDVVTGAYRQHGLASPELRISADENFSQAAASKNAYALGLAVPAFGTPGFAEMHRIDPAEVLSVSLNRITLKGASLESVSKLDRFLRNQSFDMQRLFGA